MAIQIKSDKATVNAVTFSREENHLLQEEPYLVLPARDFTIGVEENNHNLCTIGCKGCGSTFFIVGRSDYYTAIKCPGCGWERRIHSG